MEVEKTRIIVKNIPKYLNETRLRAYFEPYGEMTDCHICTKPSKFKGREPRSRGFAFIGYKTAENAALAVEKLNNTYINTNKISVFLAEPIGTESLEQCYARRQKARDVQENIPQPKKEAPKSKNPYENDPEYQEFLDAAKPINQRASWNDPVAFAIPDSSDDDESSEDDENLPEIPDEEEETNEEKKKPQPKLKSNRLYITNIPYDTTEDDLNDYFSKFGTVIETTIPIDNYAKRNKGFAFISFEEPQAVIDALNESIIFQGRHLKLKVSDPAPHQESKIPDDDESFQQKKKREMQTEKPASWNALFLNPDTVATVIAHRLGFTKAEVLNPSADNIASRLALAEAQLIKETKEMFEAAGISLDAFNDLNSNRKSRTLIIAKNLKYDVTEEELRALFATYGSLVRFLLAPTHAVALVEFARPEEASKAYKKLNFHKLYDTPMMLQWAPLEASGNVSEEITDIKSGRSSTSKSTQELKVTTLIVKNVPFQATKAEIREVCNPFGRIKGIRMPKKADGTGHRGFVFLDFNTRQEATQAYQNLRDIHLYGRHLVIEPVQQGRNVESIQEKGNNAQ